MNNRQLIAALLAILVLRIGINLLESPSPVEAYHFLCARQMDLAFFNEPPGTAAILFGIEKVTSSVVLVARLLPPFLALAATLMAFLIGRRLFSKEAGIWTAAALNTIPLFNIAALRIGPEMPALCFVLAGMLIAWRAWTGERHQAIAWMGSGLCFAFATFFKYDAVIIFPLIVAGALGSPRQHAMPILAGMLAGLVFLAAALSGPLQWNAEHDWIPIAGGTLQTLYTFNPRGFIGALAHYFSSVSPLIGALLIAGLGLIFGEVKRHLRARFVFFCAVGPMVWWLYQIARGNPDSTPTLMAAVPIVAWLFAEGKKLPLASILAKVAMGLGLLCSANALWKDALTGMGWKETIREIQTHAEAITSAGTPPPFLIAGDEKLACILGFYTGEQLLWRGEFPPVFMPESQDIAGQFSLWKGYDAFVASPQVADEFFTEQQGTNPYLGRNAIYATTEEDLPQAIKGAFEKVTPMGTIYTAMPGRPIRTVLLFLCRNYQTMPL